MTRRNEHRWVVDGIEEGVARIEEDGVRMMTVPGSLLPAGVTEGQVLRVTFAPGTTSGSVVVSISVDRDTTAKALERSRATVKAASAASKRRDPGGNVSL